MRKLGATYLESMLQAIEAESTVDLGQYREAEDLVRGVLGAPLAPVTIPVQVKLGGALSASLSRRGMTEEALRSLSDVLPLARRLGGMEFLARVLAIQAELEHQRGNTSGAEEIAAEGFGVMLSSKSFAHWFWILGALARLVPPTRLQSALGPLESLSGRHARFDAGLMELEGILARDPLKLEEAAGLYAALELPFEEGRCRTAGRSKSAT